VFFHRLVQTAGQDDKTLRKQFLISSWTLNRLAVDVLAIALIDVPYIRKWQFFGLVDASASLINELTLPDKLKKGTQRMARDRDMAEKLLTRDWFQTELKPVLEQISVAAIREEIITHTETTYEAIEAMEIKTRKANATGQQLLRAYRNSRHGYAINDREILLLHSGKIHDDIPDISIALWHYLLLKFPFSSVTK
jgi:hypothetical protein